MASKLSDVLPDCYVLCVDLEATCCDDASFPRSEMEIIEFGCAIVDTKLNKVVAEFNTFVRPTIHPTLTQFCKDLTTITQADVDEAPTWKDVAPQLTAFLKGAPLQDKPVVWMSWGEFDNNLIKRECQGNIVNPMPLDHFNLKWYYARMLSKTRECGLRGAINEQQLTFPGTLHRAKDDAKAVALVLMHIINGLIRSKL